MIALKRLVNRIRRAERVRLIRLRGPRERRRIVPGFSGGEARWWGRHGELATPKWKPISKPAQRADEVTASALSPRSHARDAAPRRMICGEECAAARIDEARARAERVCRRRRADRCDSGEPVRCGRNAEAINGADKEET